MRQLRACPINITKHIDSDSKRVMTRLSAKTWPSISLDHVNAAIDQFLESISIVSFLASRPNESRTPGCNPKKLLRASLAAMSTAMSIVSPSPEPTNVLADAPSGSLSL